MKISRMLRTPAVCSLIISSLLVSVQAPVLADIVGNAELTQQAQLQLHRDEVRSFVARDDVRNALLGYGVNAADVDARIDSLTESELQEIRARMAELPAGGGALGIVLAVILIFVLLDVLGATDIFPNV